VDIERLKEAIERVVLLRVRVRHRKTAKKKRLARQQAIATTVRTLNGAKGLNARGIRAVFNVSLYLLLLDDDLAYFTDDLVYAVGERRRRFLAKHEAILLYEAADDLPQLLGKDFRAAVAALGADDPLKKRLNEASSGLHRFWNEHREFLNDIRNALAAHREHDALTYVEKLESVKPLEVMGLAAEFSVLLERLIAVLTDIAKLTIGIPGVIADMKRSSKEKGR
jgi:hypothetical protein